MNGGRKKERKKNNRYFFLDINSGVHKRRKAHTIEIAELIKNEGNLGRISIFLSLFLVDSLSLSLSLLHHLRDFFYDDKK